MSQKKTNYLNADVELEESTPAVKKKSKKKQNKTLNTVKHVLGVIGTTFLSLFMIVIITCCIVAVTLTVYIMQFADSAFDVDLKNVDLSYTSFIYAKNSAGEQVEIKRLSGDENRIWVNMEQIPKHTQDAFTAVEDKRFYEHDGVDWKRTVRVTISTLFNGYGEGGSTITQQLVKNITGDDRVTPERKIREIFRALNLEKQYTKIDILEAYLNRVPLGGTVYGAARRLTTHSASEIPSTFTTDGNYILFSASIQDPANSALFPTSAMTELYKVPVTGGRTEQVLGTPAEMVCFDKSGKTFLYQDRKGFEDEWRKHHTSSITRDVWLYDSENGKHTNLTAHAGEDRNPVFAPDGQTVYFLSERDGSTFNVYSFPISSPQSLKTVTHFKTHPVRFLSMGSNGTLCYTYDGEIYTQKQGDKPQKVKIDIIRDDQNTIADLNFSNGATSATVSPDGKQVAFIVRGEVFVTSADYNTTKQITHTPAREAGLTFSPDNRTLAYASERNGNWELYMAKIARKEEANFPNATAIEEEVLLPSDKTREGAAP